MPSYVRIEGTKDLLQSILDISGLLIRPRTADQLESGNWEVYAYASDNAITELQNRGAIVEIMATKEETDTLLASLDDYIGEDSGGTGDA